MRRAIAVVAVFTASVIASGCAQPGSSPGIGPDADGATIYQRISDSIFGTAEDRLAAEARMTADYQRAIADCMAKAGFTYTPAPSEKQAGGPQTPGDLTTLAPIGNGDFGIAVAKRGVAEAADQLANPGYASLATDDQRAAYRNALSGCTGTAGAPEAFTPTGAADLAAELEQMFTAIEARPDVAAKLAAYGKCLNAAGFQAKDYVSLYTLAQDQFPDPSVGWSALSNSPKWSAAVAFEQRAAQADADCRADLRDTAMAIAAPQLSQFLSRHSEQLAAADSHWAKQGK